MKADINTIAATCGVSKATVSRVFTGKATVNDKIRARVLEAAQKLNYAPQQVMAQESIVIIIKDLSEFHNFCGFANLLLGALIAEITNQKLLVRIVELKNINSIIKVHTKAAILFLGENEIRENENALTALDIPLIVVNKKIDFCNGVSSDHAQGVSVAVDYLHENGHQKIALIIDNNDLESASRERIRGYQASVEKYGLEYIPELKYQIGQYSMIELVAQVRRSGATAMIVCGESLVAETKYALDILNIKVPEDLSVITSEHKEISRWQTPPCTTVDQDIHQLALEVMALVSKLIRGKNVKAKPVFKAMQCKIIERQSVARLNNNFQT